MTARFHGRGRQVVVFPEVPKSCFFRLHLHEQDDNIIELNLPFTVGIEGSRRSVCPNPVHRLKKQGDIAKVLPVITVDIYADTVMVGIAREGGLPGQYPLFL